MHPLFTPAYWFSLSPQPFQPWAERFLLVAFGALFLAGIITWIIELKGGHSKPVKRALGRAASHLSWTGLVGLLLWAFSYEHVSLLSMRAFYLAWLAWFALGAWYIFRYVWVEIPSQEARHRERTEREKWLPKRKA